MISCLRSYLVPWLVQRKFRKTRVHAPSMFDRASLKNNFITLAEDVEVLPGARVIGAVSFGRASYASFGVECYASEEFPIIIGSFCSLATGACLISSHHHHPETIATYPIQERIFNDDAIPSGAPIVLGNDVWIGARAVILPGVNIGNGAVVGAGSVVTSGTSIPSYEIWAGNPAKKIKDRFPKEAMERMKMMTWWEWDIEEIRKNKEMFDKPVM